jgi:hypothetical protein
VLLLDNTLFTPFLAFVDAAPLHARRCWGAFTFPGTTAAGVRAAPTCLAVGWVPLDPLCADVCEDIFVVGDSAGRVVGLKDADGLEEGDVRHFVSGSLDDTVFGAAMAGRWHEGAVRCAKVLVMRYAQRYVVTCGLDGQVMAPSSHPTPPSPHHPIVIPPSSHRHPTAPHRSGLGGQLCVADPARWEVVLSATVPPTRGGAPSGLLALEYCAGVEPARSGTRSSPQAPTACSGSGTTRR